MHVHYTGENQQTCTEVHRSKWLYRGTRGENSSSHPGRSAAAKSFNMDCSTHWNADTVGQSTTPCGSKLHTLIKPRADLRSCSENLASRGSFNCLLCRRWLKRVRCTTTGSSRIKNSRKWAGPRPIAHLCITPSIAMSRRHCRGARLKCTNASISLMQIQRRSALGLIWVYNHLPDTVVAEMTVSGFQHQVQEMVKGRASSGCADWLDTLNPRTPVYKHPLR